MASRLNGHSRTNETQRYSARRDVDTQDIQDIQNSPGGGKPAISVSPVFSEYPVCTESLGACVSVFQEDTEAERRRIFSIARKYATTGMPDDERLMGDYESFGKSSLTFGKFKMMIVNAIPKVAVKIGEGPLAEAVKLAKRTKPPACAAQFQDDDIAIAITVCMILQDRTTDPSGVFFLKGESLAQEMGIPRRHAYEMLKAFVNCGILTIEKKGHTGRATEFRFVGERGDNQKFVDEYPSEVDPNDVPF